MLHMYIHTHFEMGIYYVANILIVNFVLMTYDSKLNKNDFG